MMALSQPGVSCSSVGSQRSEPVSRQARILLVDDRMENLVALDAILSSLNQILVPVQSGEQALQALLSEEFAVVLLDIVMPGMDGFETAAQIKQHAKTRDVPIIFLTAAIGQPEQAFRGYAAGAVDYLAKPFDPWVLKSKVSVFVDLYLKRNQADEVAAAPDDQSLLDQVSGRLRDVEETVAVLRGLPAVTADAETEQTTARLAQRIGRLRDAIDAFGHGGTVGGGEAVGDGGTVGDGEAVGDSEVIGDG
jgi:CheY-like chemotaxis protein